MGPSRDKGPSPSSALLQRQLLWLSAVLLSHRTGDQSNPNMAGCEGVRGDAPSGQVGHTPLLGSRLCLSRRSTALVPSVDTGVEANVAWGRERSPMVGQASEWLGTQLCAFHVSQVVCRSEPGLLSCPGVYSMGAAC